MKINLEGLGIKMNVDNSKVIQAFDISKQYGAFENAYVWFPKRQIQVQFPVGSPFSNLFYLTPSLESTFAYFPVISLIFPLFLGKKWGKTFFAHFVRKPAVVLIISSLIQKFNFSARIFWGASGTF
jgi:hypothetical protein